MLGICNEKQTPQTGTEFTQTDKTMAGGGMSVFGFTGGAMTAVIAGGSALSASIIASVPTDSASIEALGKWPLTIVLGAVCCFCVWIIYKQGSDYRKSIDEIFSKMLNEMGRDRKP
ncbi:MAG: hypothetical protein Q7J98_13105 [Kiritimatiellia bacterium]|nr:hypothetical protein [Kiritimatiellia bacterium]